MNIQDLDIVDNNNQANWPEGTMKVQDVNDAGRADEGLLARWFADWNGSKITTGTGSAYVFSSDTAPTAYYDGFQVVIEIHTDCLADATLNGDSLGAATIKKNGTENLVDGDLKAGMVAMFVYRGTDWNLVSAAYLGTAAQKNTGTAIGDVVVLEDVGGNAGLPAVDGSQLTNVAGGSEFGCELVYVNATTLRLDAVKPGGAVFIEGVAREVSNPGPTISNTAWGGANTLRNVYASWNGSAVVLEVSTNPWSFNTTFLHDTMTLDSTKTPVGAAKTDGSGTFTISGSARLIRSLYNETPFDLVFNNNTTRSLASSGTWIAVPSVLIDIIMLPSERIKVDLTGGVRTASGGWGHTSIGRNGTQQPGGSGDQFDGIVGTAGVPAQTTHVASGVEDLTFQAFGWGDGTIVYGSVKSGAGLTQATGSIAMSVLDRKYR